MSDDPDIPAFPPNVQNATFAAAAGPSRVPLATIGMPVYNGSQYLEQAIRSLLSQTETDFVLIISDNASTDGTREICTRLAAADSRITYIRQDTNIGAVRNFEYVLQQATSPFFMWAADDDVWAAEFLAVGLELLRQSPDAIGCVIGQEWIDAEGTRIRETLPPQALTDSNPVKRVRGAMHGGYIGIYGLFRLANIPANVRVQDVPRSDFAYIFGLALYGRFVISERILKTQRYVGYGFVPGPNGRFVYEKALGEEGHLYSQHPALTCRCILAYTGEAPLSLRQKSRITAYIAAVWWTYWRALMQRDARPMAKHAFGERRYLEGFLRTLQGAIASPKLPNPKSGRMAAKRVARVLRSRL